MASATFNGLTNPDNIICFNGFPNILEISGISYSEDRYDYEIRFSRPFYIPSGTDVYLTIKGMSFKRVSSVSDAHGMTFYLPNGTWDTATANIMGFLFAENLRSVPEIATNYVITPLEGTAGVRLIARSSATGAYLTFGGNSITNEDYKCVTVTTLGREAASTNKIDKIVVDIYADENGDKLKSLYVPNEYVTTLTKSAYGSTIYFDLTPLITSLVQPEKLIKLAVDVKAISNNQLTRIKKFSHIYATQGYSVNQQSPYIPPFDKLLLAQNLKRGKMSPYYNRTLLYVAEPVLPLSLYVAQDTTDATANINYYNSANVLLHTQTESMVSIMNGLIDWYINLDADYLQQSNYITVEITNVGTLRYEVIKPLHATDETQRIYWTNSMGGVSFFDFTGSRTEQRKTKVEYYQQQDFGYYQRNRAELNKVYDKQVDITVTLSSHYMEKDGTWLLFDLQNSLNAWTTINGKEYAITATDIKITESSVSGIYQCQLSYEYSMADTY